MATNKSPSCIFLFDMARSRSHLFFRYLSTHPKVEPLWHPFLPAFLFGPERFTAKSKNARDGEWIVPPEDGGPMYNEVIETFTETLRKAKEDGKIFVANEHCQMTLKQDIIFSAIRGNQKDKLTIPDENPTVIPDQIFTSLKPVFVIRNPVFRVPSVYTSMAQSSELRPGDEDWTALTDLRLQRLIFDYFKERTGSVPIVIDGDDVVWRTEELRIALGNALDLDPDGFSDVWDAVPEEKRSKWPIIRYFLATIDASTGIERHSDTPPNPSLDAAHGEWCELYGVELAKELKECVEINMPHYEYLRGFKI